MSRFERKFTTFGIKTINEAGSFLFLS